MAELRFLGDPILRVKCKEVKEITPFVRKVVDELIHEYKTRNNVAGLAAPQIGYDLRIFINCYGKEKDYDGYPVMLEEPEVYINPIITKTYRRKWEERETCMSIPRISGKVIRPYEVDIEYTNLDGERVVSKKEKDWRGRCLQHEIDHLNGVLYIDHMTPKDYEKIEPSLIALEKKTRAKMNTTVDPNDFMI